MSKRAPLLLTLLLSLCSLSLGCQRAAPAEPALPPRLAYVGLDGQIYTVGLSGAEARRVSTTPGEAPIQAGRRFMRWPTWAPDGSKLAFMRFELSQVVENVTSVLVANSDGSGLTRVFQSTTEAPIYMSWQPDASSIALLTQGEDHLKLQLVDASAIQTSREIASGAPLYFAWSPDAQKLLLHVNGDHRSESAAILGLSHLGGGGSTEQLPASPTDFRAPGWSPDGSRMAFVAQAPGGQSVLSVQEQGASAELRLASVENEPAFLWSPSGDRLAFSSLISAQPRLYGGIEAVKADGSGRQRVADGGVLAFFWSPDGRKLAFVGFDQGALALAWFVVDPDGKNRRQVASFLPSEEQVFMFNFFDQYAQSHAVWSPDSKYIVYAGSSPEAAAGTGSETARGASRVFVAPVDGSSGPRAVADGIFGVWPVPRSGKP